MSDPFGDVDFLFFDFFSTNSGDGAWDEREKVSGSSEGPTAEHPPFTGDDIFMLFSGSLVERSFLAAGEPLNISSTSNSSKFPNPSSELY